MKTEYANMEELIADDPFKFNTLIDDFKVVTNDESIPLHDRALFADVIGIHMARLMSVVISERARLKELTNASPND